MLHLWAGGHYRLPGLLMQGGGEASRLRAT
jgi:hypothetical protein